MDDNPRHMSERDAGGRDMSRYTTTVADAVNLFDEAGVPRSERTIQRYCKRGHLECYRLDREQDVTYLIDPDSVERRIEELRQLAEMNMTPAVATQRDTTRRYATARDTSRHTVTSDDNTETTNEDTDTERRIRELEEEKRKLVDAMSLKDVEIRVKDKLLIDLNEQRRKDIEVITQLGESVGEWKTKYLQLAPPADTARALNNSEIPVDGTPERREEFGDNGSSIEESAHED